MQEMTPQKPYLVKAIIDWIVDNNLTPHMMVDTSIPFVQVPKEFIDNNRIVLNISPQAVGEFQIDLVWISFFTRFGGKEHFIQVPMGAVIAVYASENTQGMGFDVYAPSIKDLEAKQSRQEDKKITSKSEPKIKPVLSIAKTTQKNKPFTRSRKKESSLDEDVSATKTVKSTTKPKKK